MEAVRLAPNPHELGAARRWASLVVLTLPVLLISLDNTVLGFAVPALSETLEPTSAQLLWIVDVYSFVLSGLLVTMGNLGDQIGRRRLLLLGAFGFSVASIAAAFATSASALIAARAALGLAGATLMPSTLSLIRNIFTEPRHRQIAVATWAAMFAVGGGLGPIIGGFLLERYWWGSVFLLGVPVTVVLLLVGRFILPESRDPNPGPFDLASSALSMFAMFPAVYAMKKAAEDGLSPIVFAAAALSAVAGFLFVLRQGQLRSPMLDMALFRIPRFRAAVSANLMACFGFAGTMFFITQYLQLVVGMTPMRAGVQLLPAVGASIVCTMAAPTLARVLGTFTTIAASLVLSATGFLLLSQVTAGGSVATATVAVAVLSAGFGVTMTVAVDSIVTVVPRHKAGAGASVSETGAELGIALGTAVLGSILTSVYRDRLARVPGVPEEALVHARETLGAATVTALQIGGDVGARLQHAAVDAFTDGVVIGSLAGALALVATAWWTARSSDRAA